MKYSLILLLGLFVGCANTGNFTVHLLDSNGNITQTYKTNSYEIGRRSGNLYFTDQDTRMDMVIRDRYMVVGN